MSKEPLPPLEPFLPELSERACTQLREGTRVRRKLPGGRLSIDHPVPFLLAYRRPDSADAGTAQLITSESAYVTSTADRRLHRPLSDLVHSITKVQFEQFGACLLLEIWSARLTSAESEDAGIEQHPRFRIHVSKRDDPGAIVDHFEEALARIRVRRLRAQVEIVLTKRCAPEKLGELLTSAQAREQRCVRLGLEILPIYRSADGLEIFHDLLRKFRRSLSRALRRTFYDFSRRHTTHKPEHFHVLGRRAVVKAVWDVDRQLAAVAEEFDFLLQVSPANSGEAWQAFRRSRFDREPVFHYRHLPFDTAKVKRRLFRIPIERVEDPALSLLFRQKQDELDRQITMLADRNTRRFLHGSLQLYGKLDPGLVNTARQIIELVKPRAREEVKGKQLSATEFYRRATEEFAQYKLAPRVQLREDLAGGLMVSQGTLLIGSDLSIPASRIEALLQHEVGTHVLTYHNGCAQPFRLLRFGLAGYEGLQEGLAVLAEHLVGGLSRPRLRLLAGRVIAANNCAQGASFMENFRDLMQAHGFNQRTAFHVTMRVHRAGGLTKDALYLQGLIEVLDYLGRGGRLRPLFVGKIATEHLPIIHELQWRRVLEEPARLPRYLDLPNVALKLEAVREGMTVLDLARRRAH